MRSTLWTNEILHSEFPVLDDHGAPLAIRIDKFTADVLRANLLDISGWFQSTYDSVVTEKPQLSRRARQVLVRVHAWNEASKYPAYKKFLDDLQ